MAAPIFTTIFDHTHPAHLTTAEWRHMGPSLYWRSNARRFAARYGEARVFRADDSCVRYWRDEGKVRQRTYRHVIHANL